MEASRLSAWEKVCSAGHRSHEHKRSGGNGASAAPSPSVTSNPTPGPGQELTLLRVPPRQNKPGTHQVRSSSPVFLLKRPELSRYSDYTELETAQKPPCSSLAYLSCHNLVLLSAVQNGCRTVCALTSLTAPGVQESEQRGFSRAQRKRWGLGGAAQTEPGGRAAPRPRPARVPPGPSAPLLPSAPRYHHRPAVITAPLSSPPHFAPLPSRARRRRGNAPPSPHAPGAARPAPRGDALLAALCASAVPPPAESWVGEREAIGPPPSIALFHWLRPGRGGNFHHKIGGGWEKNKAHVREWAQISRCFQRGDIKNR